MVARDILPFFGRNLGHGDRAFGGGGDEDTGRGHRGLLLD